MATVRDVDAALARALRVMRAVAMRSRAQVRPRAMEPGRNSVRRMTAGRLVVESVRQSVATGLAAGVVGGVLAEEFSRRGLDECRQCHESGQMDDAEIQDVDDRVATGLGALAVMESWDAVAGGLADTLDLQVSEMGEAGGEVEEFREVTALTSAEVVEDLSQAGAGVDAVAAAVEVGDFVRDPSAVLAEQSAMGPSESVTTALGADAAQVLDQPRSLEL